MPVTRLALVLFALSISPLRGAEPVGWRADGTGRFPEADPPVAFSAEEGVVWRTELPGKSHSAPILVGDRVFVTADPAHLLCLRADNGAIEWQHSLGYEDLFEADRAAEIAAKQEAARGVEQELKERRRELERRKRDGEIGEDEAAREQQAVDALEEQWKGMNAEFPAPKKGGSGNSAGTPVSDGSRVYCLFATGLVTAHTLDGERVWFTQVEPAVDGFGHSASPLLVDGSLVVHTEQLTALDPSTGKVRWKADLPQRWGTPVAASIGDAAVVVTPSGAVVNAADGAVLVEKLFDVGHASPIVADGVVYALAKENVAVRLPERIDGAFDELWRTAGPRSRSFSSPLMHEGLLYNVEENGILEVFDAQDGTPVYKERLPFAEGRTYGSVTLAGERLFVGTTNGEILVFAPGREFRQVAINELEGFSGAPVFVGRRMYVRGYEHLYCVGH